MGLLAKIALSWGATAIAANTFSYALGGTYDSGGSLQLIWWAGQVLAFPAYLASEGLGLVGIEVSGYVGYMALTIILCGGILLASNVAQRARE